MNTHYKTLYVTEDASMEVIKGAYKHLMQEWHPDRNPDKVKLAEEMSMRINEAYTILSCPEKRRAYDKWLNLHRDEGGCFKERCDTPKDSSREDGGEFEKKVEEMTRSFIASCERALQSIEIKGKGFLRGLYRGVKSHSDKGRESKGFDFKRTVIVAVIVLSIVVSIAYLTGDI